MLNEIPELYQPWNVTLFSCSEKKIAKFLKAIILTESHITSVIRMSHREKK